MNTTSNGKKTVTINGFKIIGNICILVALLGFSYTFYPLFSAYVPHDIPQTFDKTSSIVIPKIGAYAPVIKNVDPFRENEYNQALEHGVAMAKGSVTPGDEGLTYIFAHSSGNPWELTRFNTIFLRIGELDSGDEIRLYQDGKEHVYQVSDKKEVWPDDVSYLLDNSFEGLILQTCTPIGTDLKRLLIFAIPQKS